MKLCQTCTLGHASFMSTNATFNVILDVFILLKACNKPTFTQQYLHLLVLPTYKYYISAEYLARVNSKDLKNLLYEYFLFGRRSYMNFSQERVKPFFNFGIKPEIIQ